MMNEMKMIMMKNMKKMIIMVKFEDDQDDEDDSHLFGGPTNNTIEGTAVPIAYGELMVGGVIINGSYTW